MSKKPYFSVYQAPASVAASTFSPSRTSAGDVDRLVDETVAVRRSTRGRGRRPRRRCRSPRARRRRARSRRGARGAPGSSTAKVVRTKRGLRLSAGVGEADRLRRPTRRRRGIPPRPERVAPAGVACPRRRELEPRCREPRRARAARTAKRRARCRARRAGTVCVPSVSSTDCLHPVRLGRFDRPGQARGWEWRRTRCRHGVRRAASRRGHRSFVVSFGDPGLKRHLAAAA